MILQPLIGWYSVTQQKTDEHFSRRHNNATKSICDELFSNTHSSQEYVNAPQTDTRRATDAPIEKDDTPNSRHGWNIWLDELSIAPTDSIIITDLTDEAFQEEDISSGGKYNLQAKPNPNFSDLYRK